MSPSVSIIIPSYNSASYVLEAVSSCLCQTESPLEVIVVDDGSIDDTGERIQAVIDKDDRVRYVYQRNQGVSMARNHGMNIARGDCIAFVDADDRLNPEAIQHWCDATLGNSRLAIRYGRIRDFFNQADFRPPRKRINLEVGGVEQMFWNGAIPPGAFCVPRDLALKVGGFDHRFSYAADVHFWFRCGLNMPFRFVEYEVLQYRNHAQSMTSRTETAMRDNIEARVDFVEFCRREYPNHSLCRVSECQLIANFLNMYYHQRRWENVECLLKLARDRCCDSPEIQRIRRLRLLPNWAFALKDFLDSRFVSDRRTTE